MCINQKWEGTFADYDVRLTVFIGLNCPIRSITGVLRGLNYVICALCEPYYINKHSMSGELWGIIYVKPCQHKVLSDSLFILRTLSHLFANIIRT